VISDHAAESRVGGSGADVVRALRRALMTLLEEPSHREAAVRIGAEVARAPGLKDVVRGLL
jgi:hypothetical protein